MLFEDFFDREELNGNFLNSEDLLLVLWTNIIN